MKKHLSVFLLAARMSIWKLVILFAITAAAQIVSFLYVLYAVLYAQQSLYYDLASLFTASRIPLICWLSFLALCFLLSAAGFSAPASQPRYALERLRISRAFTALWWTLYNVLILATFWALQILIAAALLHYAEAHVPLFSYEQAVYLSFYQTGFLHSLLPLAQTSRWICNGSLLLLLAVLLGHNAVHCNRSQRGIFAVAMALNMVYLFPRAVGGSGLDVLFTLCALTVVGFLVFQLWRWRDED